MNQTYSLAKSHVPCNVVRKRGWDGIEAQVPARLEPDYLIVWFATVSMS